MSLQNYQQLQINSESDNKLLGCKLPKMHAANLNIDSKTCNTLEAIGLISEFSADQGWLMYRDELVITANAPVRNDFIEGEWSKGEHGLKIRLLADNQYLITEFSFSESGEKDQAFSNQLVFIRNPLKEKTSLGNNAANYRLWWQKEDQGQYQGRWVPLAQQFVGFCNAQENK